VIAAGERYHPFSRGSNKLRIFFEPVDFETFLLQLSWIVEKYGWRLYAYCLMPNHYHLLIRVSDAGLSEGMRDLNGGFSRWTSKQYGRVGHLFQNRFGLKRIADEQAFLVAARYIVLNPGEAGLCAQVADWPWSSYRATVGEEPAPEWLDVAGLLEHFDVFAPGRPRDGYRRFVADAPSAVSGTDRAVSRDFHSASLAAPRSRS